MRQTNIFDTLYPKYKKTKPIRLIELFSGYGSQALALKYLGVSFEHWRTCEWAIKSIQAYKDIHFADDNTDYSKDLTDDEVKDYLIKKGISSNYNEPMKEEQIRKLKNFRTIYNNIIATKDLVNIQQVKGKDLGIEETDKYDYILTYSFPCQDLSLAGKGKGMSDTTTRSGMLWEVERILKECKNKPQILLMENVPQVHGEDNIQDFNKWQLELENMGYSNYVKDLIATDYGIPQTRNRCFMISILGEYNYNFPEPIPLKLKLKDMLEDNVDEKYFLSDKMIKCFTKETKGKYPRKERFEQSLNKVKNDDTANIITTLEGNRDTSTFILNNRLKETLQNNDIKDNVSFIDTYNRNIRDDNLSGTISTGVSFRNNTFLAIKKDTENYIEWEEKGKLDIDCRASKEDKVSTTICTTPNNKVLIKNATKKGYLEATDGDGIDISSRIEHHRGTVQKGKAQTLTTQCDGGVVVNDNLKKELCNELIKDGKVEEGDVIKHSYTQQILDGNKKCVEKNDGNMITLTTRGDCVGTVVNENNNLRIRKLTPKECFRLMGVKDEDYNKCSKNQSNASLYHLAGDSIVVNVLMAIFGELLEIDWRSKLWI